MSDNPELMGYVGKEIRNVWQESIGGMLYL